MVEHGRLVVVVQGHDHQGHRDLDHDRHAIVRARSSEHSASLNVALPPTTMSITSSNTACSKSAHVIPAMPNVTTTIGVRATDSVSGPASAPATDSAKARTKGALSASTSAPPKAPLAAGIDAGAVVGVPVGMDEGAPVGECVGEGVGAGRRGGRRCRGQSRWIAARSGRGEGRSAPSSAKRSALAGKRRRQRRGRRGRRTRWDRGRHRRWLHRRYRRWRRRRRVRREGRRQRRRRRRQNRRASASTWACSSDQQLARSTARPSALLSVGSSARPRVPPSARRSERPWASPSALLSDPSSGPSWACSFACGRRGRRNPRGRLPPLEAGPSDSHSASFGTPVGDGTAAGSPIRRGRRRAVVGSAAPSLPFASRSAMAKVSRRRWYPRTIAWQRHSPSALRSHAGRHRGGLLGRYPHSAPPSAHHSPSARCRRSAMAPA